MSRDYNCIMLDYEFPYMDKIHAKIEKNDVYLGKTKEDIENDVYGLEKNCHVTLLYGIHPDVTFDSIKKYLCPLNGYKTILANLSLFKNDDYDVLKIDAKCPKLNETNHKLCDNVSYTSTYNDYKPHMTVAYLKHGVGDKYVRPMMDKIYELTPVCFNYSTFDDQGNSINQKYYDKDLPISNKK